MNIKKKLISFFYDSKKINREGIFKTNNTARSGGDSSFCNLIIFLSKSFEINVYCTKIPKDNIYKNIFFKKVNSITEAENKIKQDEFLIFNFSNDPKLLKLLLNNSNKSKKYIVWMHNTPPFKWLCKIEKSKSLFKLIAVSDSQRLSLAHTKIYNKIISIPHFVEINKKLKKNINNSKQIIFIGALVPSKGFHLLAQIWPNIHSKYPDWKLKVIGGTDLYHKLNKIKDAHIYKYENFFLSYIGGSYHNAKKFKVTFTGSISKKKVLSEILEAEFIIVNPNYKNSYETFCISAAEGLLYGKAILGGNFGSLPEVIKHCVGGLLHNNNIQFKENLLKLIQNKKLRKQLGQNGKKYYLSNFNNNDLKKRWFYLLSNKKITKHNSLNVYYYNFLQFFIRSTARYFLSNTNIFLLKKCIIYLKNILKN
jgi:glycosyltransferase involved in cell wall biosynthesis